MPSLHIFYLRAVFGLKNEEIAAEATMQIVNKAQFSELVTAQSMFCGTKERWRYSSNLTPHHHQRSMRKAFCFGKVFTRKMFPRGRK